MEKPIEMAQESGKRLEVDYVISFRAGGDADEAKRQLESLVKALDFAGLRVEVRDGDEKTLLIFVRVKSNRRLAAEVYRSRIKDWLHGIRPAAPERETERSLEREPITEAERLRLVYHMITLPVSEGGAGITPKRDDYTLVESIFPLHDRHFNHNEWLKDWSTKWSVNEDDLEKIRNRFGERIAYYFAFLQTYLKFLMYIAPLGVASALLLPAFSPLFALVNSLWALFFVEYWRREEIDRAVNWGVRKCSTLTSHRAAFKYERIEQDPVSGEPVKIYPVWKRLAAQLLLIPYALAAVGIISTYLACAFAVEIFITEVYNGPFKSVLTFLPTASGSIMIPLMSGVFTNIATRITELENHATDEDYEAAMTRKIFVLNFITSYVPLCLTSFVYVPFGNYIVPHLDFLGRAVKPFAEDTVDAFSEFKINPGRLKKQMIYFTVTAQAVNLALEVVVPYVKRRALNKVTKRKDSPVVDAEDEQKFLKRVREEAQLDDYDVTSDLREMVMQFGYLSMFAPIWPFTSISFIVNNWLELRSDAFKICMEMKRPIPVRADSIGPWLDNIGFLSWLGTISSTALVYLFSDDESKGPGGTPKPLTAWVLLAWILFSEHAYFGFKFFINLAFDKMESKGVLKERRERFLVRKRYLEESLGVDADDLDTEGLDSSVVPGEEKRFWRSSGRAETLSKAKDLIVGKFEKKTQ